MRSLRIVWAAVAAVTVLAVGVGSASATRFASNSQTNRGVWTGLEFIAEGITTVRCPVTFEGSLHSRTISKVAGSLVGFVLRAIVGEASCQNGKARVLAEKLPWHVRYESFGGTLPNIVNINKQIIGAAWSVTTRVFGTELMCLYTTTATEPVTGRLAREVGGVVTGDTLSGSIRSGTFGCPRATLGGTGTVKTTAGANVTVTLVA
jgi:hypothetical protein